MNKLSKNFKKLTNKLTKNKQNYNATKTNKQTLNTDRKQTTTQRQLKLN